MNAMREEQHFILSSIAPGPAQKRVALAIIAGLLVALYLITGPFAGTHLGPVNAFVAVYATAMCVTDAMTGILLYAQFSILRTRAILVIASGYLFTALIIIPYLLSFPGVLAPAGLVGGLQTAAWLYVAWHCGFAVFVIAYGLSKGGDVDKRRWEGKAAAPIACSLVATGALAAAVAFVCVKGGHSLPSIMIDAQRFSRAWPYLVGMPIGVMAIAALVVLWFRRQSVLDLWLGVVMCLYLIEIPLSYFPEPVRFSLGWYAVRVIGFLSSTIVLTVLLYEITTLYARLLRAVLGQRREREARLMTGDAVAASIAHELRQPLTAMVTTADAGLRFLDREVPKEDKAKEAFRRIVEDGHRAGALVSNIRANFKSDVRERTSFEVHTLVQEALDLARSDLQSHAIRVETHAGGRALQVNGNRVQLQQVLLNLINNAMEAMSGGDGPRVLRVRSELYEGDRVIVSVSDTGPGIGVSNAERVFNPLFTTKTGGMGMGLSICRSIIEAHEGRLWFAPNSPRGAVFQFTLPAG